MDPITALAVSASVFQFIDFAGKIISKGTEYYHSADGALPEHVKIAAVAANLASLTARVRDSASIDFDARVEKEVAEAERKNSPPPPQAYKLSVQGLLDANKQCYGVASEIMQAMEDLRLREKHQAWNSIRHAFHSVCSEAKLESLSRRMTNAQEQLTINLLVQMR